MIESKEILKAKLKGIEHCYHCCMPVGYPNVSFIRDNNVLCSECAKILSEDPLDRESVKSNFLKLIDEIKATEGKYHAIFAYSGGKDSTVSLYSAIREFKLKLLVFNFDNGFKGERVINNINSVISDLNVDYYQIKSTTSYTIVQDINNSIIPCGRCSSLKYIYPELARIFNVKYIITGIESIINNEVIRNRGTFYQINWPAALNWNKQLINERIKETPWQDPGYGVFDSDCLGPIISLMKIYSTCKEPNVEMYLGKKEQHVVPYYSRLLRYGAITQNNFYDVMCSDLSEKESLLNEYALISKK